MGWDDYDTWMLVLPPSRPSEGELARIRTLLTKIDRHEPVAVMGSTPEFRDLLASMRFRDIDVIDFSPHFHQRMTALMAYCNEGAEALILDKWETYFDLCDRQYAAILSDLTLGNVPYDLRRDLYRHVGRSLRPAGYFIDKCLTNEGPLWSLPELVERYNEAPINLAIINRFNCEALFCSEFSRERGVLDTEAIYSQLALASSSPAWARLVEECKRLTPSGMVWYYGREWSEAKVDYCQGFDPWMSYAMPPDSPYFGHAFQFVHTKS